MRVLKSFNKSLHGPLACIATAACAAALWPAPTAEARGPGFGAGLAVGAITAIIASEAMKGAPKARPKGGAGGGSGKTNTGGGGGPAAGASPVGGPGGTGATPGGTGPVGVYAGAYGFIEAKDIVRWVKEADEARLQNEKREAAVRGESDRNVDDAIVKFIQDLQARHARLAGTNVSAVAKGDGNINEVTDGTIRQLVDEAYKLAHLDEFDPGLQYDTMWSRERLMVFILRQARFGIEPFYTGVGAKGPSAENLRMVFLDAAREVYARALETAEVMGVGQSFNKFIGKLHQASTGADDGLPTLNSDGRYEKLMSGVIDSVAVTKTSGAGQRPSASLSLDRQFLFRFRARRTLYDCVSSGYARLAKLDPTMPVSVVEGDGSGARGGMSSGPEMVTVSVELWRRVEAHVKDVCRAAVQTGVLKAAIDGDLRPVAINAESYVPSGELSPIPMSLK